MQLSFTVTVATERQGAWALSEVKGPFFGNKVEKAMRFNGRGAFVIAGEDLITTSVHEQQLSTSAASLSTVVLLLGSALFLGGLYFVFSPAGAATGGGREKVDDESDAAGGKELRSRGAYHSVAGQLGL